MNWLMEPNEMKIDKSTWGPGPWQDELDHREWEYKGFHCILDRTPQGSFMGLVGVGWSHPWFGLDYTVINRYVAVHGGLTYSELGLSGSWWLMFHCAHRSDYTPHGVWQKVIYQGAETVFYSPLQDPSQYRDFNYVTGQTELLARQLEMAKKFQSAKETRTRLGLFQNDRESEQ